MLEAMQSVVTCVKGAGSRSVDVNVDDSVSDSDIRKWQAQTI